MIVLAEYGWRKHACWSHHRALVKLKTGIVAYYDSKHDTESRAQASVYENEPWVESRTQPSSDLDL